MKVIIEVPPVEKEACSLTLNKVKYMLTVFEFEGKEVRFVGTKDKPEWVAQDVCDVLGIKNSRDVIARLKHNRKGVVTIDTLKGIQTVNTVYESGLYQLIFTSRKAVAERFQDWVFEEVLPSIRKTGSYSVAFLCYNRGVP